MEECEVKYIEASLKDIIDFYKKHYNVDSVCSDEFVDIQKGKVLFRFFCKKKGE